MIGNVTSSAIKQRAYLLSHQVNQILFALLSQLCWKLRRTIESTRIGKDSIKFVCSFHCLLVAMSQRIAFKVKDEQSQVSFIKTMHIYRILGRIFAL
jgi:hypothetical protein